MEKDAPYPDPMIIEPVGFRTLDRGERRARSLLHSGAWLLLAVIIAASGAVVWYSANSERVVISVTPTPDRFALSGPRPQIRVQDAILLRHGEYTVSATREGYEPLVESFSVGTEPGNRVSLQLQELPGLVRIRCFADGDDAHQLENATILVDGVVRDAGEPVQLDRGTHVVRAEFERYRAVEERIDVEGFGQHQDFRLTLLPDWAQVTVRSLPPGADVIVDGISVASTPCQIDMPSGRHVLELQAEGFETWRNEFTVAAQQPIAFKDVALQRARGSLTVRTTPPGAQVLVGDTYAGTSPVSLPLAPDEEVLVQAVLDGYRPARRTVRIASGGSHVADLVLTEERGLVRIEAVPAGAVLAIDGIPWGPAPTEISLPARETTLEFELSGFEAAQFRVRPRPDFPVRVAVQLQEKLGKATGNARNSTAANGYPLVLVEAGAFRMGASRREQGRRANETLRNIRLERPFWLGTREVTNAEYAAFDRTHQSGTAESIALGGADRPVVRVTWDQAAGFCNWLSSRDGLPAVYMEREGRMMPVVPMTHGYRLPTEAEWEYAGRFGGIGSPLKYPWGAHYPPGNKSGNFADEAASGVVARWIEGYDDDYAGTAPVGSFQPNALGVHDMGGNVAEWCHDFYKTYTYSASQVEVDPMGPSAGRHHAIRGSSWRHSSITALRMSYRDYSEDERDDLGFRICRYAQPAEDSE